MSQMQNRIPDSLTRNPEPGQHLDPGYDVTGNGSLTQQGLNKVSDLTFNRVSTRTGAPSEAIEDEIGHQQAVPAGVNRSYT